MCPHCVVAFLMGLAGIGPIATWARSKWIMWRARRPAPASRALGSDRCE